MELIVLAFCIVDSNGVKTGIFQSIIYCNVICLMLTEYLFNDSMAKFELHMYNNMAKPELSLNRWS